MGPYFETVPWWGWILAIFCASYSVLIVSILRADNQDEDPPASR